MEPNKEKKTILGDFSYLARIIIKFLTGKSLLFGSGIIAWLLMVSFFGLVGIGIFRNVFNL